MVKIISTTYIPHQTKDIVSSVNKPLGEVTEDFTNPAAECSRKASEAVTSMQKALLSVKDRPCLNLDSEAVKFFGLKSYEDMAFAHG